MTEASSKLGTFITVAVDPASNDGLDQAPGLVTGAYEDGSLRVRVFGSTSEQDTVRNHVGDDGEPYEYPDAAGTAGGATDINALAAKAGISPEQLRAVLSQLGATPQGAGDAPPPVV